MAKLKKMLGKADAPYILALMNLIETQSKTTIANWCLQYTEDFLLPVYEKEYPDDTRPKDALSAAREWLAGNIKLPEAKKYILACHSAAREAEETPAAQAAARAAGQAASTIHVATHSLGIAFYGAAALAYTQLGLHVTPAEYEAFAEKQCGIMLSELQKVAVKNEPNPVKVKWYC